MKDQKYRLRLFISGATKRSAQAVENITAVAEKYLTGHYELEVIDAFQQADVLSKEQIVVLPTLVKALPYPIRRLVGDLSNEDKVLIGLDLVPDESAGS